MQQLLIGSNHNLLARLCRWKHNNQKDIYLPLLCEGEVYSISNVKIVPGPALYRSVNRDLAINFYYKTKIQKMTQPHTVPRYKFELKEFGEIPNFVADVRCFIDIAGMVLNYGQLETRTNGAHKLDVILTNAQSEKMAVALWEDKATHFLELLAKESNVAGFVVITGLLAKKYSDRVLLSTSDATKTFYNIDLAPLNNLRAAIAEANGNTSDDLPKPIATRFATVDESSLHSSTIKEILETSLPTETSFQAYCPCERTQDPQVLLYLTKKLKISLVRLWTK
ncbi:replication factor A protein 1 isoform X1 [Apium graveolens]|uniref:replication factor A protein 1 isoform X1 n=1 Tax=Apium graveolens TaxID=4045 RepID=UPI003D7AD496